MRGLRRTCAAGVAVVVAVGLVGCSTAVSGTGTRSVADPAGLLAAARADVTASLAGNGITVLVSSDLGGSSSQLQVTYRADTATGSFRHDATTCELRRVDGTSYARADAAFWTTWGGLSADTAATVDDVWVEATGRATSLANVLDGTEVLARFTDLDDPVGGATSVRENRPVREIGADAASVTVFTEAPYRLWEAVTEAGQATFTYPGSAADVAAPEDPQPFPV